MQKTLKNMSTLMIITLPIMVGLQSGSKFNIALSDLILPMILVQIIMNPSAKRNGIKKFEGTYDNLPTLYIIGIVFILLINLLKTNIIYETSQTIRGITNTFKIAINIFYFICFNYLFMTYGNEFKEIFIKSWNKITIIVSITSIAGVVLYLIGIRTNWSMDFRATGTFNDPNLLAIYLLISLSISIIYNIYTKNKIIGINIILSIVALLLTASRAAIITVVVATTITIFISFINHDFKAIKKISINIIYCLVLVLLIILSVNIMTGFNILELSMDRLGDMSETIRSDSRISKWIGAIIIWMNYPILGAGIGMYIDTSIDLGLSTMKILTHNTYLSFLAELGIIGFVAFMWFPFKIYVDLIRVYNLNRKENVCLLFSMNCIFVTLFTLNLENFRVMWVFYIFIFNNIFKQLEKYRSDTKYIKS
ncbi:O-antigen ligase domain-containing protein [Romboutsia ilealis]|uniref:O-antigen ligase family protein n=1 Tax=Romboutsia faecis TaxID=2764597 RepID=A0ABR7JLK5_9FIRM|nr:O-antigen ligase family protein [Romboutsia faecis]MBC5995809.1 O-antigen ligase family protein [Romboutsia faecis]MRN23008.1 O-antigen ligase domain-containing protein [Romboutsia ilealis]